MADDLGYGDLSVYGQTKFKTPNVDKLAADGVRFTQYHSASPVCAPTRCSLLTGKHQGHAAIRGNNEVGGWELNTGEGQEPLPASEVTIAERLKAAGYATCAVGKWGLGGPATEGHPNQQGFDHFFGYLCQRQAHNYYPAYLWNDNQVYLLEKNRYFYAHPKVTPPVTDFSVFRGEQYSPDLVEQNALQWIDKNKKKPFFLYYATTIPHVSIQAPEDLVDQFPAEWDEKPYQAEQGYLPNKRPRAAYAAMITHLDRTVGRLRAKLAEIGQDKNTIIVFTSDNGAAVNGGADPKFFNSNSGFRGNKTLMWEGGIRVPFIVYWPGRTPSGAVRTDPTYSPDIYATLLDMTGQAPQKGIDGVSLTHSIVEGQNLKPRNLYFEFRESPSQAVIMEGNWKAIRPRLGKDKVTELYNLNSDPAESKNMAKEHPELIAKAEKLFLSERFPSKLFPLPGIDK